MSNKNMGGVRVFLIFSSCQQKKSNMGRSYTHKNHQLIFISNLLNSAFSRIATVYALRSRDLILYCATKQQVCILGYFLCGLLFYILLNMVYFPRVCDTNLSVWKKKEPPNESFQCHSVELTIWQSTQPLKSVDGNVGQSTCWFVLYRRQRCACAPQFISHVSKLFNGDKNFKRKKIPTDKPPFIHPNQARLT